MTILHKFYHFLRHKSVCLKIKLFVGIFVFIFVNLFNRCLTKSDLRGML